MQASNAAKGIERQWAVGKEASRQVGKSVNHHSSTITHNFSYTCAMKCLYAIFILFCFSASAQRMPDVIYMSNIKTVKLFQLNNQESLPVIRLNSADQVELHFDDMDAYAKSYYYTFQLCNADWSEADLSPFDYLKGFQNQQIFQYRQSSVTLSKYMHYQVVLPESNCVPTKSGNYLLKIFLDGDTSKLAFTKRFFVVSSKAGVGGVISQPFNNQLYNSHQKIQFSVNASVLNPMNPQQQINVVVMQNYRWDNIVTNIQPAFIRDNILEYNGEEDCLFPAGKEYRWADLRSFRFESERVAKVNRAVQPNELYLFPDGPRTRQGYLYMKDYNGWFDVSVTESINPWWQSDYGNVHFTFVPENHQPYTGKNVYLMGELTGNNTADDALMQYNADKGVYEKTLLLKQGYYNYTYATKDMNAKSAAADVALTDGNYWETENDYTIFVYYRSLSGRHDELVGFTTINSLHGRGQ